MLIQQLSIFIANRPGHVSGLTGVLAENNIDIRAAVLFDTVDYGILRTVVDKPAKALEILKKEGYVATISDVVAVELDDATGRLHSMFAVLAEQNLNVEYSYCFVIKGRDPLFVLKTDDTMKAAKALMDKGFVLVDKSEVCSE
ncbi:MAG: hypothetical protein ACOX4U_01360 [Anaerovoracaceae bacterium]|jgi:hypothetical protein